MANIRVDLNGTIKDGSAIMFRSPADCSAITGLIVYYVAEDGAAAYKEFVLADAHGHNVGDIDHLFAENVVVKVILDVTAGMAYVQNADTNAYIERTFIKSINGVAPDENGNVAVLGDSGSISVTDIPGGHRITIGGADGVTSFDVMNGQKGDSFTFEDLTEEQLAEFRSGTVLYTAQALGDAQKEQARANIGAAPASHATDKENPHGVTAEQVGAAPASHATDKENPHGVTAEQVGAAPASHATDKENPHGVTAEQVGAPTMEYAKQVGAPYNHLRNSYWQDSSEIVNQRGKSKYTGSGYTIDGWILAGNADDQNTLSIGSGYIGLSGGNTTENVWMAQKLPSNAIATGTKMTFAVKQNGNPTPYILNFEWGTHVELTFASGIALVHQNNEVVIFNGRKKADGFNWAVLFDGEYTAENLPKCRPQDYAEELVKCQLDYRPLSYNALGTGYTTSTGGASVLILPFTMRNGVTPTFKCDADVIVRANGNEYSARHDGTYVRGSTIELVFRASGIPAYHAAAFHTNGTYAALSTELL